MRRLRSRALLQRQVRAFEGWRECHEGKVERRAARRRFGFRGWLEGMHAQQAARAEAALKRRVSRLEATMAERLKREERLPTWIMEEVSGSGL